MEESDKPIFSISNIHIIEYLIRKLESKEKKIKKINEMTKEKYSKDFFLKYNNEIIQLFNELEKDLNQAICAVKALLTENKALSKIYDKTECHKISKSDLTNLNNFKIENSIIYHSLNTEPNYTFRNQLTPVKEENYDSAKKNNQLSHVKNIMKNMNENKLKLKLAIENHFSRNNNLNNRNKYNSDSNLNKDNYDNHKILIKIIKNPENFNLLHKKFGNNFMRKILDKNCTQEYLENINKVISEKEYVLKSNFSYYKTLSDSRKEKKMNFIPQNDFSSF